MMATAQSRNFFEVVEDYERKLIGDALAECNGNQARAARLLGLKPTTLNSQIQRLGIDVNLYRQTPPHVSYETFEKFVLGRAGRSELRPSRATVPTAVAHSLKANPSPPLASLIRPEPI